MAQRRCLRYEDHTVGWVSALPVELAAATQMVDEIHHPLPQHESDTNIYTLGHIGTHNVVLACLPAGQTGTNSAAKVATLIRSTYPNLRFCLMVGIGGGVPSSGADIRLGDVVVGQPNSGRGGVVQYDYGKSTPSGFERTGFLNAPSDLLLSALSKFQALHLDAKGNLFSHSFRSDYMANLQMDFPAEDFLFEATYAHIGGADCHACDEKRLVRRTLRNTSQIRVHYGTIASGNQVIRDGIVRDQLSSELGGILCFEMEAAGLANDLSYLAIRGVCDYADSHKNKMWQRYAATTAALYARGLLVVIMPSNHSINSNPPNRSQSLIPWFRRHSQAPKMDVVEEDYYAIVDRISDYEPERTHWEHLSNRCPGTTAWVLETEIFKKWFEQEGNSYVWLTGKIGSGKTLLSSSIVEYLGKNTEDKENLVASFFYSHSHRSRLAATDLFRSYIKQILRHFDHIGRAYPSEEVCHLQQFFSKTASPPTLNELIGRVFVPLNQLLSHATYVVDGLDECEAGEVERVLKAFRMLLSRGGSSTHVLISGREALDIQNSFPSSATILIGNEDVKQDIRDFVEWRIEEKTRERHITENESLLLNIKTTLIDKADRMILWVSLQIDYLWDECFTDSEILTALSSLPKDLNETYERCLKRISARYSDLAPMILRWVCAAIRPFTIEQLREALAIDFHTGELDTGQLLTGQDILRSCANLISKDGDGRVVLAHQSVRQFLSSRSTNNHFFPQGFELDIARLELGQLCIAHLSSPTYSLAVQHPGIRGPTKVWLEPQAVARLTSSIPSFMRFGLPRPKTVSFVVPQRSTPTPVVTGVPQFFHFAREQWLLLTHQIDRNCKYWGKIRNLALVPNLSWRLHPWPPFGQSIDSHYSGLLGWAIINRHIALLDLLVGRQSPPLRDDIFKIPLYDRASLSALFLAAREGCVDIFYPLLKKCELRAEDQIGRTVLHHSAEVGALEIAKILLKRNLDPESPDRHGTTAVQLAVENGQQDVLEIFLDRGLPGDPNDYVKYKALPTSAKRGHEGVVRVLLKHGADIHSLDGKGKTALVLAAQKGHETVVQVLLDYSNNSGLRYAPDGSLILHGIYNKPPQDHNEALYQAARHDRLRIVEIMLNHGVNPDLKGDLGDTALHGAVMENHLTMCDLLLRRGATASFVNRRGNTALHLAVLKRDTVMLQKLLEAGANVNAQDSSGANVLYFAIKMVKASIPLVLEHLLENGVNANKEKLSEIFFRYEQGSSEISGAMVRLLLHHGADVHAGEDKSLSTAIAGGDDQTAQLLVDPGVHMHCTYEDDRNMLYIAASKANIPMLERMMRFGVFDRLNVPQDYSLLKQISNRYGPHVKQLLHPDAKTVVSVNETGQNFDASPQVQDSRPTSRYSPFFRPPRHRASIVGDSSASPVLDPTAHLGYLRSRGARSSSQNF